MFIIQRECYKCSDITRDISLNRRINEEPEKLTLIFEQKLFVAEECDDAEILIAGECFFSFSPSFFFSQKNLKIHARCLAPACFKILYQTRVSGHCQFIWATACNALSNVQHHDRRIFIILLLLDSTHYTTPQTQNLRRGKFTFFSFTEEG